MMARPTNIRHSRESGNPFLYQTPPLPLSPTPLVEQLSGRLNPQAGKSPLIPLTGEGLNRAPQHPSASEKAKSHTITLARWRERVRDSVGEGQWRFIPLNFKPYITSLATAWILACSLPTFALEITYVYDGDTVKIKDGSYEYKLRLTDIDAPERNQDYGLKSRRALMQFCKKVDVKVYISGTDKYQRRLGKLHCNSLDASEFMVKNGHAWFNRKYSMDYMLALQEDEARKNKLGLWSAGQEAPPWVWRKNQLH